MKLLLVLLVVAVSGCSSAVLRRAPEKVVITDEMLCGDLVDGSKVHRMCEPAPANLYHAARPE